MADEFYIGYENGVPQAVSARLRRVVPAMAVVAIAGAAVVLVFHGRLLPSRFDFGRPHTAEGVLTRRPYPALDVEGRSVRLVGQGKHGAEAALGTTPDGGVQLQGSTIARGQYEMLEVVPGTVESVASPTPPARATRAGGEGATTDAGARGEEVTLSGEIVDSKCFLGVMNPGEGTVHRDCARLCLRGGIPPMLLVRGDDGAESLVLLVSAEGDAIGSTLVAVAGRTVSLRGRLTTADPMPVLRITSLVR